MLKEPIIPLSLWQVFADAASNPDTTDPDSAMYQVQSFCNQNMFRPFLRKDGLNLFNLQKYYLIQFQAVSELPQPNRDTLAYLMIHLQAIAENYKVNKVCMF